MTAYVLPVLFGGVAPGLNNPISNTTLGQTREFWQDNCAPSGRSDACSVYAYGVHYGCDGCTHPGSDVDTDFPERIYAVTDGVVTFSGPDRYYCPEHVDIRPTVGPYKDEIHIYGHMSRCDVAVGQSVRRGQLLGLTGAADCMCFPPCPHVHWERRKPSGSCSSGYCSEPTRGAAGNGPLTDANANGTTVNPPTDPVAPPYTAKYGDIAKATTSINVRATPAGAVIGTMATGGTGEVLSENAVTATLSGTSYAWVFVNMIGKTLKGWVATTNLALSRANRIANPHLQNNTVNLVEYKPGVTIGRVSVSRNLVATGGGSTAYTDYWATVACDGSVASQGVYFRSPDIKSDGYFTKAWGHVSIRNVSAGDSVRYVGIRLIYDSGPNTDKWVPAAISGTPEQRISIPEFAIDPSRRLMRAQFYTFADTTTGNPRAWEVNRAIVYLGR